MKATINCRCIILYEIFRWSPAFSLYKAGTVFRTITMILYAMQPVFFPSSWSGKRRIPELELGENASVISRDFFGPRTANLRWHLQRIESFVTLGIYFKICSIFLHYPLKFKSRSFRLCLNPLLKEQASSRYELVGQRERGTSIYLCAQSLCGPFFQGKQQSNPHTLYIVLTFEKFSQKRQDLCISTF